MIPEKQYRAIRYNGVRPDGSCLSETRWPCDTYAEADRILGDGPGFIEHYVKGIGWCYATEPEREADQ